MTTSAQAKSDERAANSGTDSGGVATSIHMRFVLACGLVENVKRDTDGQVGSQKYKYANLESVLEMLQPILKRFGLALTQFVDGDGLRAKLVADNGQEMDFGSYNLGSIGKHQDRGSAITYGRRYQLCSIFGITQEDDDGAAASKDKEPLFKTKVARTQWFNNFKDRLNNSGSLDDLKGQWMDEAATLNALKVGDADEEAIYDELEKIKNQVKSTLAKLESEYK